MAGTRLRGSGLFERLMGAGRARRELYSVCRLERRPRGASRSACLAFFSALEIERRPRGASLSACLGFFSAPEIERRPRGASRSACLGFFSALEIERRPRGASRGKPAPTFVATRRSSQAMVVRLGAWLKTGGAPAAPTEKSRRANKADNYGLTGHGTLQQM